MIRLMIGHVDGERSFCLSTPDPHEALAFLDRYDHEGSSVTVVQERTEGHRTFKRELDAEHAYLALSGYDVPVAWEEVATAKLLVG